MSVSGQIRCSLRNCNMSSKLFSKEDEHVDVKTVPPSCGFKMDVKYEHLQITWANNGDASFHTLCWDKILKASRSRNRRLSPLPDMTGEEKYLVKEAAKTAEMFDSYEKLKIEAEKIVQLIENSKHCVFFTGAGISTSAGIGDYRGKSGKWTTEDQNAVDIDHVLGLGKDGASPAKHCKLSESTEHSDEPVDDDGVEYEKLRPTYTHEAIQKLLELSHIKYVISQNGDGLHGLSGVQQDQISELHGNIFIEKCEKCGKCYERSYYVMDDTASLFYEELLDFGKTDIKKPKHAQKCRLCKLNHRTGRKCDKPCGRHLIDTIINFGDNLDQATLDRAIEESKQSDLMVCLGTTLTVTPANSLVEMTKKPQRIVICNRQKTDFDEACSIPVCSEDGIKTLGSRVFGDCDILMREVMKGLMSGEKLMTWEQGRTDRLNQYAEKRN